MHPIIRCARLWDGVQRSLRLKSVSQHSVFFLLSMPRCAFAYSFFSDLCDKGQVVLKLNTAVF